MKFKSSAALVATAAILIASAFSCSSQEPTVLYQDDAELVTAGSVRLALTVGGNVITSVTAVISAKHDFQSQTHTIDVTGETGVVSIFFGDLPAQRGYNIELTAGECSGAANFNIDADTTTLVPVTLTCPGAGGDSHATGSVQVTGTIVPGAVQSCDHVKKIVAAPSIQNGNSPVSSIELVLHSGVAPTNIAWAQTSSDGGLGTIGNLVGSTDREVTFDCSRNGTVVVSAVVTAPGPKTSCTEQARVTVQCLNQSGTSGPVCGDGVVNGTEQCDGTAGVGTCPTGTTGTVTCNPTTCQRNTSACVGTASCGNGQLDTGEQCDGPLGVGTCPTGTTGTVTCNAGTCTRNTTACVSASCGNGQLDTGEQCDGPLGVGTCPTGTTGTVTCNAGSCTRNTSGCVGACGNGQLNTGEQCDGPLGVGTCPTGTTGTVTCTSSCTRNTSGCVNVATCGNSQLDTGEQCDGPLGVGSCPTGTTGTVTCSSSCTRVTTGCVSLCGNNTLNAGEECDGAAGVGTCPTGTTGTVTCNSNCTRNTTGCVTNLCGNGTLNAGEECDGAAGVGTCATGQTGTVTCNSNCTRNTSGCHTGAVDGACQASCVDDTVNNGICAGFFGVVAADSKPVLDCIFGTNWPAPDRFSPTSCVNGALTKCMCGSVAPAQCFPTADPATLRDAPCLNVMIQATGCNTQPLSAQVNCVAQKFVNPDNPSGRAVAYAQCLQDNCGDICFAP